MNKVRKILLFVLLSILFVSSAFAADSWEVAITFASRMKFFLVLVPAAFSDSINPCAFAVMFILLSSILREQKSKRTVLLSGFLFTLAVFISYTAMWLGLYKALASNVSMFWLKIAVWILWLIVWLWNLKDYFWYWKFFKFEVPDRWRPNMTKIIKKVVSPAWAFLVWFIISLFLLPCTSWPYFVVLWYLASGSDVLNTWGYIYILIYNIIFILPMILISFIVSKWYKWIAELKEYKELNVEKLHLITWIIMLILWIYVLWDAYGLWLDLKSMFL